MSSFKVTLFFLLFVWARQGLIHETDILAAEIGTHGRRLSTDSGHLGLERKLSVEEAEFKDLQSQIASGDAGLALHAIWELHGRLHPGEGNRLCDRIESQLGIRLPERFRTTTIVQNSADPKELFGLVEPSYP